MTERLCCDDAWTDVLDDPAPRSVRWAKREVHGDVQWTRWHYTEGNGLFTACGMPVQIFTADGSPQFSDLADVDCLRCLDSMGDPT